MTALLASYPDRSLEQAALEVLPQLRGAFSLVFMDEETLYAARDPQGIRPLVLGRLERGWVVASETAALDIVGAAQVREIEPGELISIDAHGLRSSRFAEAEPKGCLFEYVYLARPDTKIAGRSVHATRVEVGRKLAEEAPAEADLVIPVPESGTPAAVGYSQGSGIPYGLGLVKNSYVGRTFIQPSQTIRQLGIRLKLNPLREVIAGQRLVVVDDSIVRGNTQRALVRMLREAGAAEIHVRISSPPVKWPCFYGIDFASPAELIANGLAVEEIRASIDADSLAYISLEGLVEATEQPIDNLCRACFDGVYPVELPEPELLGKYLLEVEPVTTGSGGIGAASTRRWSAGGPPTPSTDPDDDPTRSPADQLPDLGLRLVLPADLGEDLHGRLEVLHRLVRPAPGVHQVGQVVVQRPLAVPVAQPDAQGQRRPGEVGGRLEVTLRPPREREVVQRGDLQVRVAAPLGQRQALGQLRRGRAEVAVRGGEQAQQVVRLAARAVVTGDLGQLGRLGARGRGPGRRPRRWAVRLRSAVIPPGSPHRRPVRRPVPPAGAPRRAPTARAGAAAGRAGARPARGRRGSAPAAASSRLTSAPG